MKVMQTEVTQHRQCLVARLRTGSSIPVNHQLVEFCREGHVLEVAPAEAALTGAEEVVSDGDEGLHALGGDNLLRIESVDALAAPGTTMLTQLVAASKASTNSRVGWEDDDAVGIRGNEHAQLLPVP